MLHLCINVSEHYIRAGPETRAGGDRYFQEKHCFLLLNSEIKISTHLNKESSRYVVPMHYMEVLCVKCIHSRSNDINELNIY